MLTRTAPRHILPTLLRSVLPVGAQQQSQLQPQLLQQQQQQQQRRWLTKKVPAPHFLSTEVLMERRTDRDLPDPKAPTKRWTRTLPWFAITMAVSAWAIINWQEASSSVVSSILYALRMSPQARDLLGNEVYFASWFPRIRGRMAQMRGIIDIRFWVAGSQAQGVVRFSSRRTGGARGVWETLEWSLEVEDERTGRIVVLDLLEEEDGFVPIVNRAEDADAQKTRGFRSPVKSE